MLPNVLLTEISPCVHWGQKLIMWGFLALVAGGAIAKIFFFDQLGKGVLPSLWWVLIPIWSCMILGCFLCTAGWMRFPAAQPILDLPFERYSNERIINPLINFLTALVSAIMLATPLVLAGELIEWHQVVVAYWLFCCSVFSLFLTTIFTERYFPVTASYANALLLFFSVVMIPLAWPIVAILEYRESAKRNRVRPSMHETADPRNSLWENMLHACEEIAGPPIREFDYVECVTYLRFPEPVWLREDPVDDMVTLFDGVSRLYDEGVVVWGHLIQANELLFEQGHQNCPGEMVFSVNGSMTPPELQQVAQRIAALKGTHPADESLAKIAKYLTDEYIRVFGLPVSRTISTTPCFISSTFFVRHHLPNGMICRSFMPLLVSLSIPHIAIPLPERFWPSELIELWTDEK